ncbi:ras-related protein Rab-33B-like [Periophthalmus magnuspinnatus]|uniref:ras-related protein Rab-33B-like n=1 Tax=Periophthalmus magnuspinnatus TaxID=409849 RepID=UPI00145A5EF1|nr:ras-related protein Rab-33B-like [Periophthalmus magnuspinnatus]
MDSSLEFSSSLGSVSSLLTRHRTFKVLMIGDSGVGKTCLTHRLCAGEFPCRAEATIGVDFRERLVEIDGEKIRLQLWDTAGQERFRKSMVQHYYRNVHAIFFVYDVTSLTSFSGLNSWIEECRQNSLGQDIPKFLVGNKSDLRDPSRANQQVNQQTAMSFAKAHGMMCFETSAKISPNKLSKMSQKEEKVPIKQDQIEDIVLTVAGKLKRHTTINNISVCNGSFKVTSKKGAEKESWSCC